MADVTVKGGRGGKRGVVNVEVSEFMGFFTNSSVSLFDISDTWIHFFHRLVCDTKEKMSSFKMSIFCN